MSVENPLWGAPRIHGELLKLGFEIAQSSVAKYMVKRRGPPSQGWRTFLRNHAHGHCRHGPVRCSNYRFRSALCLRHRPVVWINVITANPTAEWVARQITEAFPWDEAPRHLIRDRDRIYGSVVTPIARHGHPGQAYRASLALVERLCRTADRIDPA
jgi:hypothetical protein